MAINKIIAFSEHSLWDEVQQLSARMSTAVPPPTEEAALSELFSIYAQYGLSAMGFFRTEESSSVTFRTTSSLTKLDSDSLEQSAYYRLPGVFHAIFNPDSGQLVPFIVLSKAKIVACITVIEKYEYGDGPDTPELNPGLSDTISYLMNSHISPPSIRTSGDALIYQKRILRALEQYFEFAEQHLGRSINAVHVPFPKIEDCCQRHFGLFFSASASPEEQSLLTEVTQWFLQNTPLQTHERSTVNTPQSVKTAQGRVARRMIRPKLLDEKLVQEKFYSEGPMAKLFEVMGQMGLCRAEIAALIEESLSGSQLGIPDAKTIESKLSQANGVIRLLTLKGETVYYISLRRIKDFNGKPCFLLDSALTKCSFRDLGLHKLVSLKLIWDHLPRNLFKEAIFVTRTQNRVIEKSFQRFPSHEDSTQAGGLTPLAEEVCHCVCSEIYHCEMGSDGIIKEAYPDAIVPEEKDLCAGLYLRDAKMLVAYASRASGAWLKTKQSFLRVLPCLKSTTPIPSLRDLKNQIEKEFFCLKPDTRIRRVADHIQDLFGGSFCFLFGSIKDRAIRALNNNPEFWDIILSKTTKDVFLLKHAEKSKTFEVSVKLVSLSESLWFGISENIDRTIYGEDCMREIRIGIFRKIDQHYLLVYGCRECFLGSRIQNAEQGIFKYALGKISSEQRPIPRNWLSNGIRLSLDGRFEVVESAHPRTGRATNGFVILPDELCSRLSQFPLANRMGFLPIIFIPDGIIRRIESL